MQAKKIKIIKVPLEGRKKLAERYGCCRETIFNALAFRSQSKQSEDIRRDALNDFGGVKTEKVVFYMDEFKLDKLIKEMTEVQNEKECEEE